MIEQPASSPKEKNSVMLAVSSEGETLPGPDLETNTWEMQEGFKNHLPSRGVLPPSVLTPALPSSPTILLSSCTAKTISNTPNALFESLQH